MEKHARPTVFRPAHLGLRDRTHTSPWRRVLWQGLAGFGVAAVMVPGALALGNAIGKGPSNFIAAALPGLLFLLVAPPAAVASTEWLLGEHLAPGSSWFQPAFWTALGAQLVAMTVAIAAKATTREIGSASAFAVADAILVPGVVTLMMALVRPRRARRRPVARARGGGASASVGAGLRPGDRALVPEAWQRELSLMEESGLQTRNRIEGPAGGAQAGVQVLHVSF